MADITTQFIKKNVLVFPCGSEIGLEINKSLSHSIHFKVFGGSSVEDHGKFVFENYVEDIPFVEDADFINKLNSIVKENSIDYIIPAHDSVVLKLAQENAAGGLACTVITSDLSTCEIARSKLQTYRSLSGTILTPKIFGNYSEINPSEFPIFLKPDVGQGSKGTYKAETMDDVTYQKNKDPSLLLMEYLPGKEYTVDCFTNKNGKLLFSEGRERSRVSNGISVSSGTVNDNRFSDLANSINGKLSFRGAWFFQVKENVHSELVLLEVAPRIAGTMGLVRCKGVNLVLLSLFDAIGYEVDIFENKYSLLIDRALENRYKHDIKYANVYIDFDDLIVFDSKINVKVMAFIYQCLNKDVKVKLITKHRGNLNDELNKYRISNLFDEIIWIQDKSAKYLYIKEQDSIFIDDSFMERKSVYERLNIPVFDSHMIESLMEI